MVPLSLRPAPPVETQEKSGPVLSVAIIPFEDTRPDTSRLGTRHHLWGGESYFNVPSGKPGEVVAEVVADYLRKKGWRADVVKPGVGNATLSNGHDVTLSGKLLDLSADANSEFMRTKIAVNSKILVQGLNAADGSTIRMTLNGTGSQHVFWFEPDDVQALLNDVMAESLAKLSTDTKIEDKVLRLK
jgi:hypothetical protein